MNSSRNLSATSISNDDAHHHEKATSMPGEATQRRSLTKICSLAKNNLRISLHRSSKTETDNDSEEDVYLEDKRDLFAMKGRSHGLRNLSAVASFPKSLRNLSTHNKCVHKPHHQKDKKTYEEIDGESFSDDSSYYGEDYSASSASLEDPEELVRLICMELYNASD